MRSMLPIGYEPDRISQRSIDNDSAKSVAKVVNTAANEVMFSSALVGLFVS